MTSTATFGVNDFVRRQTPESHFSHFDPSVSGDADPFEYLAKLASWAYARGDFSKGYKEGVILVRVSSVGFYSGVVEVTDETELKATFGARREGEQPYVSVVAVGGKKIPARAVDLVCYSRAVLGTEASGDSDFELISINAQALYHGEPQHPISMARNMLNLPGGSPAQYTANEFAESIIYWSKRVMAGGSE